ncbi:FAD-binding protein [Streptomyces sp. NPDC097704]|uniref:FAD-binding protein n=1 Tax=Streptomyces sp. NPDC097704 TaxID=3157101 RepID=UPI00332CC0E6
MVRGVHTGLGQRGDRHTAPSRRGAAAGAQPPIRVVNAGAGDHAENSVLCSAVPAFPGRENRETGACGRRDPRRVRTRQRQTEENTASSSVSEESRGTRRPPTPCIPSSAILGGGRPAAGVRTAGRGPGEVRFDAGSRVLSVDRDGRRCAVEPGIVLDDLNGRLTRYGLQSGPRSPTHATCTIGGVIGGVIGNNSCGSTAQAFGKVAGSRRGFDALLYDGTRMRVGRTPDNELGGSAHFPIARARHIAGLRERVGRVLHHELLGEPARCLRHAARRGRRAAADVPDGREPAVRDRRGRRRQDRPGGLLARHRPHRRHGEHRRGTPQGRRHRRRAHVRPRPAGGLPL